MRVLIVGAGWAGLSAAVHAVQQGWQVTLQEATHAPGGRARTLHHDGLALDNGQHILIGAYTQTLALMRTLGLAPERLLHREPLALLGPEGHGLRLPALPAPWNFLAGVWRAAGWTWRDRLSVLRAAWRWQQQDFQCDDALSVRALCQGVSPRAMSELMEPLCVSALNTPSHQASARVFLRVLRDALWSGTGGSDLLLPKVDIGRLLPDAASQWLSERGANLQWGRRWSPAQDTCGGEPHDAVILACPAREAARLTADQHPAWSAQALALQQAAIATVYVRAPRGWTSGWPLPMLSLPSNDAHPAQFVFDRGRLLGDSQRDVLACVVSASTGTREDITSRVLSQLQSMCATPGDFTPLLTVVEKRATFACTPGLTRPTSAIGPGWWACGDYVQGPYPATLEGAVRSGREVIDQIAQARQREGLR